MDASDLEVFNSFFTQNLIAGRIRTDGTVYSGEEDYSQSLLTVSSAAFVEVTTDVIAINLQLSPVVHAECRDSAPMIKNHESLDQDRVLSTVCV